MAAPTLFTLPPHLRAAIAALVATDAAPTALRAELAAALHAAASLAELLPDLDHVPRGESRGMDEKAAPATAVDPGDADDADDADAADAAADTASTSDGSLVIVPEPTPATVDAELVDRLSAWAATEAGKEALRSAGLDPADYSHIALLAGAEVYLPPKQRRLMAAAEQEKMKQEANPYLPAYVSPAPPSLGSEYRQMMRQLSTVANVVFSVVGAGAAAYVAATSGGGWAREPAIVLAVAVGAVVAAADTALVYIFKFTLGRGRRDAAQRSARLARGSGAAPGTHPSVLSLEDSVRRDAAADGRTPALEGAAAPEPEAAHAAPTPAAPFPPPPEPRERNLRLRRAPIGGAVQ